MRITFGVEKNVQPASAAQEAKTAQAHQEKAGLVMLLAPLLMGALSDFVLPKLLNKPPATPQHRGPPSRHSSPQSSRAQVHVVESRLTGTIVSGTAKNNDQAARPFWINMTPLADLIADDLDIFASKGTLITGMRFGDVLAFDAQYGVPVELLDPRRRKRGLVEGHTLHAGLSIALSGVLPPGGEIVAVVHGWKPLPKGLL